MNAQDPNIGQNLPAIRQLDDVAVNRIAAGEVVERPASAVKELIENAIDAHASRIELAIKDGGKTMIRVSDDGHGMSEADLPLALSRHATSKIDGSDLLNIHTFGFRGEALPSLGAVGRLTITSRAKGSASAFAITVSGGTRESARPAALATGTVVELRDLFYATPARLKFLRSDRAETQAISDVVKRLAMAEPYIGFTIRDLSGGDQGRVTFRADPQTGDMFSAMGARLRQILGADFAENALQIDAERDGISLTGFASLPTYSRGAATAQYLFVNGRPVRDKLLIGALRGAYSDFLSRDRHPVVALFLECDPQKVDVNVHPAKAEVRFRDPAVARGLIVSALKHALAEAGHRASSTVAEATLGAFRPEPVGRVYQMDLPSQRALRGSYDAQAPGFAETAAQFEPSLTSSSARVEDDVEDTPQNTPLGAARAQVHENYIVAQTSDGLVLVDQHAAHERLVYEKLKRQMAENGVATQALLIPEIVDLSENDAALLLEHAGQLARFGLKVEPFGKGSIAVRETPAILGVINAEAMLRDILDEIDDLGDTQTLADKIEAVLSRVACHGSIRSGRVMRAEEMNALLREMEATPHSGQCNHGRPTYVELKLADIEKLFGRT
ncbi:MAG: DNA mismatch repair endonuclease MutL [Pseudomonadota bacterium]